MSDPQVALARIDTLLSVGLRLAASTTTGRIALAKAAANLDAAWIPEHWRPSLGAALERAAAARPEPLAFSLVEAALKDAWGVRRVSDELESLESQPAAVTWTSQVHRGVREGQPVAVKVLRPGLAGAVRQDLALLDALIAPAAGAFPGIDPSAMLSELRERAMDELDLENEAALMRRCARALRDGPVIAPRPVSDLCREGVLVSEWLEGQSLGVDGVVAGDVGAGHDSTAAALLQFVIGGLREGLIHCDLDLADVLVLDDGRLAVLDYGAVVSVDPARADLWLAAVEAVLAADALALESATSALGLLAPGHGEAALAVVSRVLGDLAGPQPTRLDAAAVGALVRRLGDVEDDDALALLLGGRLAPGDLYPARGVGQLFSVIARLGARECWRDQIIAALRGGWAG